MWCVLREPSVLCSYPTATGSSVNPEGSHGFDGADSTSDRKEDLQAQAKENSTQRKL